MSTDLTRAGATELADLLASGQTSSAEITQALLDRTAAVDGAVHAYLHIDAEGALATAREVDELRSAGERLHPLAGVPIAVKDVMTTTGLPTTCGSRILEGWIPPYDATVVSRIKAARMPILGKTNMDEFAMGSSTEHSAYGPTHNPWDLDRIPGGSGGGSAAVVASFQAPLATGTDTGGSIRQPAAVTGTVGTKPTYGGVSRYGLVALASSLDQAGPCARSVLDAALLHEVMGGHDPMDSTSIDAPVPPVVEAARRADVSGMRIGIVSEISGEGFQPGVLRRFEESVQHLVDAGAEVVEVSCPSFTWGLAAYYLILPSEASSNLAKFDAMRYGLRVLPDGNPDPSAEEVMAATREAGFGAEVKRRIILGTYALSSGYYDAYYGSAQKVRRLIADDFAAAFERADVLVSPTAPTTAFRFGDKLDDPLAMYMNDVATIPANLAGVPGMSLPSGLADEDGLPAGFQILAPATKDERLYAVGAALEQRLIAAWGRQLLDDAPDLTGAAAKEIPPMTPLPTAEATMAYDDVVTAYDPVMGLEVHVELGTATKMFCGCATAFGAEPNTQVCPVCLGLPGALPVVNEKGVEGAIRIGLALNCEIAPWCRFARKNYFYPDMPKNFQTSQYDEPIAHDGWLDVELEDGSTFRVEIERAHMEEDTGKSLHVGGATGRIHGATHSLVDYNRAGIPLIEIVTKPIVGAGDRAPEVARAYVSTLRDLVKALGVSDVKMEQGSMRCDVNLSLMPTGTTEFGIRSETKNVNSLRSVERAVRYEMCRHGAILADGGTVVQETRHWHEDTGITTAGRVKSDAEDYRYFPEPDLVPVAPSRESVEALRATLPEPPAQRRKRLQADWGYSDLEMRDVLNAGLVELIEETVAAGASPAGARKWWSGEIARRANDAATDVSSYAAGRGIRAAHVVELEGLVTSGRLNDPMARQVWEGVLDGEGTPTAVADARGLELVRDDSALEQAVRDVIAANPDIAQKVRDGKTQAAGALIGQVMKATRGQADAAKARELILAALGS